MSVRKSLTLEDIEIYSLPKALEESIDLSKFRCEKQRFADYLRSTALEYDKNNVEKVWLFVTHEKEVVGYVTLIMSQLAKTFHQKRLGKLTPRSNVPGILIGEMAGHIDYKGIGKLMISWVVSTAIELSKYTACKLIIVESEEDKIDVYRHWGFEPVENFEEKRNTMFLEIAQ